MKNEDFIKDINDKDTFILMATKSGMTDITELFRHLINNSDLKKQYRR